MCFFECPIHEFLIQLAIWFVVFLGSEMSFRLCSTCGICGVCVFVVFWWGCGSVMGRPWCELQAAGEWALGVSIAKLWRWWGRLLEELVVRQ
jgi:hypothetical protein